MKWLRIENQGELPKEALLLMGASTKRQSSSAIGMFGTGAKYAIAALVREEVEVEVHTTAESEPGEKRFRFRTEEVSLRGQVFHQLFLREGSERTGSPLNFTTEMGGLNWSVEAALRELVSNALDEPEPDIRVVDEEPRCQPGKTRVYVRMVPVVREFWGGFDRMFTMRREPLHEAEGVKLYRPMDEKARVYRRGVLVWTGDFPAAFDYDLQDLEVNEERKADQWTVFAKVGSWVDRVSIAAKRKVLESAAKQGTLENQLNVRWDLHSEDWKELVGEKIVLTSATFAFLIEEMSHQDTLVLPEAWVDEFKLRKIGRQPEDVLSTERMKGLKTLPVEKLTLAEKSRLYDALGFLGRAGIEPECPVEVFEAPEGSIILGEYLPKEDKIALSRRQLQKNKRDVVETLFEEIMHRRSRQGDKTRAFQNVLIGAWMDMAQERVGEWL